jgi:hypothetical protein
MNNKQGTEKGHAAEGIGFSELTREGGEEQGTDLHGNVQ